MKKVKKYVLSLFLVRGMILIFSSMYAFSGPHIWRQQDTLGVTYRYFLKLKNFDNFHDFIMPSMLNAPDQWGHVPMEFPLLYLILSPLYYLGPDLGDFLVRSSFFVLGLLFVWLSYRKLYKTSLGEPFALACLLLPFFSFSANQFGKYMPDFLAMSMALYSCSLSYSKGSRLKIFAIGAIALLLKPVVVVVFCLLFFKPIKEVLKDAVTWVLPGIGVTLVYYRFINNYIKELSTRGEYYALEIRNPFEALSSLFHGNFELLKVFTHHSILPYYSVLVMGIAIFNMKNLLYKKILGILAIQFIFITALVGDHIFNHLYYLIGLSPLLCFLVMKQVYEDKKGWLRYLFVSLLSLKFIDLATSDFKPVLKPHKKLEWSISKECKELKNKTVSFPWGEPYHFRTSAYSYPLIENCFKIRGGSEASNLGVVFKDDNTPECSSIAETKNFRAIECP